jgi:hypothetical protein
MLTHMLRIAGQLQQLLQQQWRCWCLWQHAAVQQFEEVAAAVCWQHNHDPCWEAQGACNAGQATVKVGACTDGSDRCKYSSVK